SSRLHHQYNLNQSHRSNNIKTTPTDRNGFCYQRNHCRVQRRSFHCHRDSHLGPGAQEFHHQLRQDFHPLSACGRHHREYQRQRHD
ncbi:hypothetical protein NEUTE1DRAFT_144881, partial [Neurospora tetrasperma FGSC 2508]